MILDKKDFKFKWVKNEDHKIWTNLAIDVYLKSYNSIHTMSVSKLIQVLEKY